MNSLPPVPDVADRAMTRALELAARAASWGDVPVGAVVLDREGVIVGEGANRREVDGDPTAHAEILALREAAQRLGTWRLEDSTVVVTLEPCTMCAGAIVLARVARVVLGAWEPKTGAAGSIRDVLRDSRSNHRVEVVGGHRADEAQELLTAFFAQHRAPDE